VEWKLDERDSQYTLLEVNPRFWGTLELSMDAGIPFPLMAAQVAAGIGIETIESYRVGIGHRWIFPRELYSCLGRRGLGRIGGTARFLASFLDPRYRYSFDPPDMRPEATIVRNTLNDLLLVYAKGQKAPWRLPLSEV